MTALPTSLAIAALLLASSGAWAVEYGTVLSSRPVLASVANAQRQCVDEPVVYQRPNSGVGALIGAIAGAAVGNGFGAGVGRAAATGVGMVAGAAIGDHLEAEGSPPVAGTAQRCRTVMVPQERLVGYDVVYEYQGVRRSVRLAQDPGAQIALEVVATPVGTLAPPPVTSAQAAPAYLTPADAVYETAIAPAYAPPPVIYAPPPAYVTMAPLPYLMIGSVYGGYVVRGGYGGYRGHGGHGGFGRRH